MKTWFLTVTYKSEIGPNGSDVNVDYAVDDIVDVHELIQRGPGIAAIRTINFRRMVDQDTISIEAARQLRGTKTAAED